MLSVVVVWIMLDVVGRGCVDLARCCRSWLCGSCYMLSVVVVWIMLDSVDPISTRDRSNRYTNRETRISAERADLNAPTQPDGTTSTPYISQICTTW